jgi:hypothetical protein
MVRAVRRWLIVMPAVVVIAALSVVGYALAQTSSSQTGRDRRPTVAAFCATHTSHAGFWAGYGGHASFLRMAVNSARWNHRQFDGVASTLCGMLHRVDTGHTVLVPGPRSPAHARRRLHRPQLVRAIGELERLPDATKSK